MDTAPLSGLVPMIHVANIERSAAFYRHLGFEIGNAVPRGGSQMEWAWLYAPASPDWKRGSNLMLTRSSEPVDPRAQAVLFYLYAADLPALRQHLLDTGVSVSEITFPEYLPNGECCATDPDGYTLMIAQSAADTP